MEYISMRGSIKRNDRQSYLERSDYSVNLLLYLPNDSIINYLFN
jgi:hypothetical protein